MAESHLVKLLGDPEIEWNPVTREVWVNDHLVWRDGKYVEPDNRWQETT